MHIVIPCLPYLGQGEKRRIHRTAPAPIHRTVPAPIHRTVPAPVHRTAPAPIHRTAAAPKTPPNSVGASHRFPYPEGVFWPRSPFPQSMPVRRFLL